MQIDPQKLRAEMNKNGFSISEFKRQSGIKNQTIERALNGKVKNQHSATVFKMCAALGVKPEDILKLDD